MSLSKKIISVVMVFSLMVVGMSLTSKAFGGHNGMMGGPGYNNQSNGYQRPYHNGQQYGGYSSNPLDLSEEQQDKITDIREKFFEKSIELNEQLQEVNWNLREMIYKNGTSEEITNLRNKMNNLQIELDNLRINYWEDLKEKLTKEQLEKLSEFQSEENEQGYGPYQNRGFGQQRMMGPGFSYKRNFGPGYGARDGNMRPGFGMGWCY
jgi:Spy/CpxP family protein refolding chaperone